MTALETTVQCSYDINHDTYDFLTVTGVMYLLWPLSCLEKVAISGPYRASMGHIAHQSSRSQCVDSLAVASCHVSHASSERTNSLLLVDCCAAGWVFSILPESQWTVGGVEQNVDKIIPNTYIECMSVPACVLRLCNRSIFRHTFRPFSKGSILQESIDGHCMRNKSPYVAISKFQQCSNLWWFCANFRLSLLFLAHRRCKRHLTNLFLPV